jgi:hypothetical protein
LRGSIKTIVIATILVGWISAASAQEALETYRRKAIARDYDAQQDTALCLRTGKCVGSPVPNAMEACAWRMVILGSGHGNVDASDVASYQDECQSLISDQERAVALTKAEDLFRDIYKRELPADRPPP